MENKKEIIIKRKKISYTESLVDNQYNLLMNWTKPANATSEASNIILDITAYLRKNEDIRYYSDIDAYTNAYITRGGGKKENIGLSGGVYSWNDYYYLNLHVDHSYIRSWQSVTQSEADFIHEAIKTITTNNPIFNESDIKKAVEARDIYDELKRSIDKQKKLKEELAEAAANHEELLTKHNLTKNEAEALVTLINEGAEALTMLNNIKSLMA